MKITPVPSPRSYWVIPGKLLAGCYPGDKNPKEATAKKFEGNAAMARGTALEPEARKRYEAISKICVAPACRQSNKHNWQRASIDGLAASGNTVVEIKCGESVYRRTVNSRQVPS